MTIRSALFALGLMCAAAACGRMPEGFDGGGTGGVPGTGGAIGAGGLTCAGGTVSFKLLPGALDSTQMWCQGRPGMCSGGWHVSLKDAAGHVLARPGLCTTMCDTCSQPICPPLPTICMMSQPLSADGATSSWDGRIADERTCGQTSTYCQTPACAPPGRYTAVMCAYPTPIPDGGQACFQDSGAEPVCVEVPFDYPAPGPVVGVLP